MKRSNCFACCATFKPSRDAVSEVSPGQFSLHPSADSAEPFGRVAQYTWWTPLNCTYGHEFSQRAARHPATSPDFIILCSVSSQQVCHADWINLWSLPSREALPTMSLCHLLLMPQHHHHRTAASIIKSPTFKFRWPHASPATALTHQPVPSSQFRMCCRKTARYLHTVCFCHNSIRNCPWSAVSVNLFHIDSSAASALATLVFPQFFLSFFEPFGSLTWDKLKQITRSSLQRHYLPSCPCWILTARAVSVHYLFFSMLNSCSDPLVCTQDTAAYVDRIQSLSYEMRSRLPS